MIWVFHTLFTESLSHNYQVWFCPRSASDTFQVSKVLTGLFFIFLKILLTHWLGNICMHLKSRSLPFIVSKICVCKHTLKWNWVLFIHFKPFQQSHSIVGLKIQNDRLLASILNNHPDLTDRMLTIQNLKFHQLYLYFRVTDQPKIFLTYSTLKFVAT